MKRLLWATITAIVVALPLPSSAITINEWLGRTYTDYEEYLGKASGGLILTLSTEDSWKTALFDVTIRTHRQLRRSQVIFDLSNNAGSKGIVASNFRGSASYDDTYLAQNSYLDFFGSNNDRFGFMLSSTDPSYSVWDALSSGFGFWHGFWGNEYDNSARLSLTYPGITSYTIQLGEAAAVPVPPSIFFGLGGFLPLALIRRKRKRSRVTPAKTTRVPAEA